MAHDENTFADIRPITVIQSPFAKFAPSAIIRYFMYVYPAFIDLRTSRESFSLFHLTIAKTLIAFSKVLATEFHPRGRHSSLHLVAGQASRTDLTREILPTQGDVYEAEGTAH